MTVKKLALCAAVVSSLLAGCVGTPHKDPSEISSIEIGVYQSGMLAGCKSGARKKNDVAGEIACDCVVERARQTASREDWQRATFYSQQRKEREEYAAILPHVQAAMQACKSTGG